MYYDLDSVIKAYNKGAHMKFLFFWGSTPPANGQINETCLSQWWMGQFQVDNVNYSCAEQYMMAEKARLFHDEEMLNEIMKANQPKAMKAFGRAVKHFDKETWDNTCRSIVVKGSLAKFSQNPELWNFLKSTRNRILVEASPRDRIWGIGMGRNNPDAECPLKWRGTNLLGFALTEARDLLLAQEEQGEIL